MQDCIKTIYNNGYISEKDGHLCWKLSSFQKEIEAFVSSHKNIWRFNAVNESQKYLQAGLRDRDIHLKSCNQEDDIHHLMKVIMPDR